MSTYVTIDNFTPAAITVAEAKQYCRVDNDQDDLLIDGLKVAVSTVISFCAIV